MEQDADRQSKEKHITGMGIVCVKRMGSLPVELTSLRFLVSLLSCVTLQRSSDDLACTVHVLIGTARIVIAASHAPWHIIANQR
jgi:hypothetical protein